MSVFSNRTIDPPQERAKYAEAVLGLVGGREPMSVLRDTPDAARRAVDGLTAQQLRAPEAPGKWSIAQVLQHLADSDLVWGWRLRLILAQDRPALTGYDQDLWADRLHYADADAAQALEQLRVLRRGNLGLIDRATPQDLKRVGVHSERGEESVEYLIGLYAGHDLLHLRQIARIRASL
ncbi:MAG TPA: DinB family protein [Vicinamibacterales bacterium]|nr:DinB family protein [Vicinamibacterales bacterium]